MSSTSTCSSSDDIELSDFLIFPEFLGLTEDVTCYRPQGYHPVKIGDVLGGSSTQYRIMHKLGFGGYATVWLAQKLDTSRAFVALKVTTGWGQGTKEADMTEAANASVEAAISKQEAATAERDDPQSSHDRGRASHVLRLHDMFEVSGPNGTHAVLVTDIVVPFLSLKYAPLSPRWRKVAAYGLVKALAHMHRADIVHGDLHIGNVGVAVPQLAEQSQDNIMQELGDPDLTVILTVDPAKQASSLPPYIVTPCDLAEFYLRTAGDADPQTKVFDFGNACKVGDPQPTWSCAVEACAPEVSFARYGEGKESIPATKAADIWALGATIYALLTRAPLFHGIGHKALVGCAVNMAGYVPPAWQTWWDSNDHLSLTDDAETYWLQSREYIREGCSDDEDTDAAIILLRRVLTLGPAARPSCEEIMLDPWFQDVA